MDTKARLTSLLRAQGLKATPKRLQLLSLLSKAHKPMSATELKSAWRGSMDAVTLYRALEALVAASIVRRVDLQHGHTDYELIDPEDHHHHLVCTSCGDVEDLEWCPRTNMEKRVLKDSSKFAQLRDHALEFFGTCNACVA